MIKLYESQRTSLMFISILFSVFISLTSCAAGTHTHVQSTSLQGRPLQQVAITTKDLERAKHFYSDTLGLHYLFESNGMLFFDMAGTRLMIAYDANRPDTGPTSILYFDVDDFHMTAAGLKNLSVDLDGPIETVQTTADGDLKIQQFRDPDGNALAVMGLVK